MKTKESGNLKCIFCGGDLCWNGDKDLYEVNDEISEDDGGVMGSYTCQRCGRDHEIFDPPKEERESIYRDYWNSNVKQS